MINLTNLMYGISIEGGGDKDVGEEFGKIWNSDQRNCRWLLDNAQL